MTTQDNLDTILSDMAFRCAGGITDDGRKEYMPAKEAIEAYVTTRVKEAERLARIDEQNWLHINGVYTITDGSMLGGDREDYVISISKEKREKRLKALTTTTNGKDNK